ncbi:MAG: hypothetical protein ABI822_29080, partial [Bryobacteraceae bacterium]
MMAIRPFTEEWTGAVRDFNARMAGSGFEYPLTPSPDHFLALEDAQMRGGYILRRQRFWIQGKAKEVAHYRLPLSEGIRDRAYASLGIQLVRHALKQQPLLYALGMGGFEQPLPRMLKALGWNLRAVPFLFKVNRAAEFLRHIQPLRKTPVRRVAMDFAADSGLGRVGLWFLQRQLGAKTPGCEVMASFLPWSESVWTDCRDKYGMIAERDAVTLDTFYREFPITRLKVGAAGWAAVVDTQMRGDKYFGDMRLGTMADCLAAPGDAATVTSAAVRFLEQRGVDLIVSNQL